MWARGRLDGLEEKTVKTGLKLYIGFKAGVCRKLYLPTLKAELFMREYLLGTAFASDNRKENCQSQKKSADAICHGCTGKGNDQVRFDLQLKPLLPI